MDTEEMIKYQLKSLDTQLLDRTLQDFITIIDNNSASPSKYSLAREKCDRVKQLIETALKNDNLLPASLDFEEAVSLLLEIKITGDDLFEFYQQQIKIANILLYYHRLFKSLHLLVEGVNQTQIEDRERLQKIFVGFKQIDNILEIYKDYLNEEFVNALQIITLRVICEAETIRQRDRDKHLDDFFRELRNLTSGIVIKIIRFSHPQVEEKRVYDREKALKLLEERRKRTRAEGVTEEGKEFFNTFKAIINQERGAGEKIYLD